ncbi:hypothetical protein BC936DRAFT_141899, partial [Jimgerdemannia flammicorona]
CHRNGRGLVGREGRCRQRQGEGSINWPTKELVTTKLPFFSNLHNSLYICFLNRCYFFLPLGQHERLVIFKVHALIYALREAAIHRSSIRDTVRAYSIWFVDETKVILDGTTFEEQLLPHSGKPQSYRTFLHRNCSLREWPHI